MNDPEHDPGHRPPWSPPQDQGWSLEDDSGFIGHVGPIWSRAGPMGKRAFCFLADERHANLIGVVQGGMLMTFADRALGRGAQDAFAGVVCVTVHFAMQFMSSATIGERLEIVPEVLRKTSSLVFARGLVCVESRVIGSADGVWKRVAARRQLNPPRGE